MNSPNDNYHNASGSRHWWWQRVSALALVPLTIWFAMQVLAYSTAARYEVIAWLSQPLVAGLVIIYLLVLFFHSQLGLQVVVEDYIGDEKIRGRVLWCVRMINIVAFAVAIVAVIKVVI